MSADKSGLQPAGPTAAAITEQLSELAKLKKRRFGSVEASCATCRHAWPLKMTLAHEALECRAGPPLSLWYPTIDRTGRITGFNIDPGRYVPRIVGPGYFCSLYSPEES